MLTWTVAAAHWFPYLQGINYFHGWNKMWESGERDLPQIRGLSQKWAAVDSIQAACRMCTRQDHRFRLIHLQFAHIWRIEDNFWHRGHRFMSMHNPEYTNENWTELSRHRNQRLAKVKERGLYNNSSRSDDELDEEKMCQKPLRSFFFLLSKTCSVVTKRRAGNKLHQQSQKKYCWWAFERFSWL